MGKAQSVVSTHVAMLEDALGVDLFDRSQRMPLLTDAGRMLLPEARSVLRQSHRFDACAMAQYSGEAVDLSIVLGHGVPLQSVSSSIAELSARYPFLRGSFRVVPHESVWSQVNEGKAHIGMVLSEMPPSIGNCEMACLGQMRYCLVASRDSELGRMKVVTVEELARHRQIIVEDSYRQNFSLNGQSWLVNDMLIAVYWASMGIGWTAIPYGLARSVMEDRGDTKLVVLDLQGVENFEVNIYMVWNTAFARPDILEFLQSDLMQRYRAVLRESHSGFAL